MLEGYITIAEGVKRKRLSSSHLKRLCRSGDVEAQHMGRLWLILASSLDAYKPKKPGIKLGQKINRSKKCK